MPGALPWSQLSLVVVVDVTFCPLRPGPAPILTRLCRAAIPGLSNSLRGSNSNNNQVCRSGYGTPAHAPTRHAGGRTLAELFKRSDHDTTHLQSDYPATRILRHGHFSVNNSNECILTSLAQELEHPRKLPLPFPRSPVSLHLRGTRLNRVLWG
jgi:hypothetical protein